MGFQRNDEYPAIPARVDPRGTGESHAATGPSVEDAVLRIAADVQGADHERREDFRRRTVDVLTAADLPAPQDRTESPRSSREAAEEVREKLPCRQGLAIGRPQ